MNKAIITLLFALIGMGAWAQSLTITGTVTSADDGEPLAGATVKVKGKTVMTAADMDGHYKITVSGKEAVLEFTYVGYSAAERKVAKSGTVDVVMQPDAGVLDEVVVIGYGAVRKSDLTGSVSSVNADKLTKTPAASLSNALQGQVAGVTVNSLTGRPGAGAEVRIRGVGTVNGASPIYVVDGVIADNIDFLSPNDIEHLEVLKDASATAIYGARGANGVIIVTTKAGGFSTPTHISFNGYVGVQQRWKKLNVMNAKEYADTYLAINGNASMKKYYEREGLNGFLYMFQQLRSSEFHAMPQVSSQPNGFDYSAVDTDWQDEVFRDGMIQNYHLSIDGGSDKVSYSMSGSWFGQEGIIIGSDYTRFTGRINTTFKAFPWLKVGENISFMSSVAKNAYESGDNSESAGASIISAAFAMAPWDPVRYPEGAYSSTGKSLAGGLSAGSMFKNVTNPFSMVEYSHPKVNSDRLVGNVFMEILPVSHLTFRSTYSFDYRLTRDRSFGDAYVVSAYDKRTDNFLCSSMARSYYWNNDNILTYDNRFGKHNLTAMAGFTLEEYNYYSIGGSGSTILNPVERNWYLSQVTDNFGRPGDSVARNRRQSWLGRVNYAFDNRYLLTVNFRADGSSKFSENRWGYFPSFALAWKMNNEAWLRNVTALNDLKLRLGWGKVGNDNIGNDAFLLKMFNTGPTFVDYVLGTDQQLAAGAAVLTWINQGGHWENTEQWSAGIDFRFWNGLLSGSIDGFIRDTNDMLMAVNVPAPVGNRYAGTANVGKVRNKGIELQLDHTKQLTKDFRYSIGGNVSFIDNKLVALNGGSPIYTNYQNVQVVDQGHPLYYYWGYQYEGVYRSDEEVLAYLKGYDAKSTPFHAGDAKYRDVNGDGVIDDSDRVELGSTIPKVNYGINLGAWYKGFDLQLFFQGTAGSKIYNQMRERLESDGSTSVLSPVMTDVWTADNPDGSIPNPRNSVNFYVSDRFLEKGDYFRLKNVQLGYSLPQKALGRSGFTSCRFYVQCSNVFTATKYSGYDPEVSSGVDYGNYPQSRTFLFGVNITY